MDKDAPTFPRRVPRRTFIDFGSAFKIGNSYSCISFQIVHSRWAVESEVVFGTWIAEELACVRANIGNVHSLDSGTTPMRFGRTCKYCNDTCLRVVSAVGSPLRCYNDQLAISDTVYLYNLVASMESSQSTTRLAGSQFVLLLAPPRVASPGPCV